MEVLAQKQWEFTLQLPFCSIWVLDRLDDAYLLWWQQIFFSQSTESNANLFQKPSDTLQNNVLLTT